VLARGWTFRSLIVWNKISGPAVIGSQSRDDWPDVTEVCGFYTRGCASFCNNERLTNVWAMHFMTYAEEKFRHETEIITDTRGSKWSAPLHPCQKPLLFAERMIRASTRPGDTVWVPFGGTLREMVAAERMARGKPGEARRVISCELNLDGVDYIGPAVAQAQGLPTQTTGQADLFGGGQ